MNKESESWLFTVSVTVPGIGLGRTLTIFIVSCPFCTGATNAQAGCGKCQQLRRKCGNIEKTHNDEIGRRINDVDLTA